MFEWKPKAVNQIFLDENTGGKGKYFKTSFLQPGLVKYSFGVCVLEKDTIDKFIQGFVGCPVIIDHKDITSENADKERVGVISRTWYDETDGWYWGEGIIFDEKAISLINDGYNVSCGYEISEYSNNVTNQLHNGNPYDKVILNGKPEHLAIVKNPRYENALIAVNALDKTEDKITGEIVVEVPSEEVKTAYFDGILQAINEIKETDMFKKLFKTKETKQMEKDELKSLLMECLTELTAKNEADENKKEDDGKADDKQDKKEDKDAENKCKNEVVDKRKLIDEVAGIMKSAGCDDEVIRTAIAKMEKIGYDKSEADDKADNCGKKSKNEDDDKKEKELLEKAANSLLISELSKGKTDERKSVYLTQKDRLALGEKLF